MRNILQSRLTFANVVSVLALFVALGGASYAALKLPKNSVGARQLKNNAVTTVKIKKNAVTGAKVNDHSLTGDDIDLAKLGTVPSAQTANTASGLAPAEATHFVGTAGEPPFTGEATNAGPEAGYVTPKVGFYKDHEGIVHLTGMAKTDPVHTTIFILPVGYRPAAGAVSSFLGACGHVAGTCDTDSPAGNESRFAPVLVAGTNASIEAVNVEGRVLALPGVIVSLDGISFRAES